MEPELMAISGYTMENEYLHLSIKKQVNPIRMMVMTAGIGQ